MRLPAVLSVCTKTAWSPSARAVTAAAAGVDTLAKAGVAAIAAAAAVVAVAMAAAAVTRIAVLTKKLLRYWGCGVLALFSPRRGVRVTPARWAGPAGRPGCGCGNGRAGCGGPA